MSGRILVDSRAGSNDQLNASDGSLRSTGVARFIVPQHIVRVVKGLPTDVYFTGRGPGGRTLEVGIEYKTIWDALACVQDGRFSGNQLRALREFDYGILLIEGIFRRGSDERGGRLEVYGQPLGRPLGWYDTSEWGRGKRIRRYVEFEHWYWSMMFRGGVHVLPFTAHKTDSGRLIGSLHAAFNDKAWEEHTSHLQHSKAHLAPLRGDLPPFVRAIIEYTGVGDKAAMAAERTFGGSMRAASAPGAVRAWARMLVGGGLGKGGKAKRATPFGMKRARVVMGELIGGKGKQD